MKERFSVLDSFRGLAALCVVMYHMHFVDTLTESNFFRGSFVFVDFFFVLSGFVLAHGYGYRTNLKFPEFFRRRFLRLFPLHVVMLLGFIGFEASRWVAMHHFGFSFNSMPFSGSQDVSEILPNLLLLQAWLPSADAFSFNAPSWSISVEFYMYLLLFLTLLLGARFKQIAWLFLALAGAYLTLNTTIWSNIFGLSNEVLRGLVGFFGGTVVYLLYRQFKGLSAFEASNPKVFAVLFTVFEAASILSLIHVVSNNTVTNNLNLIGLFCFVVLLFSFEKGLIARSLRASFFQYLGKISYSIYLTHSLVLLCFNALIIAIQKNLPGAGFTFVEAGGRHFDGGNAGINYLLMVVVTLVIIAVSHMTFHQVERRWYK